jgi:iron complex outermembrane receptor protein
MLRKTPLATAVGLALVANAFGLACPALAQDIENNSPPDDFENTVEVVIVTGTRIPQNIYSSALPVDVLHTEAAQSAGVSDLAQMLQMTPIAAGSSQVTSAESAWPFNRLEGGIGVNTLSLRGMGPNRTLTLLNGRRAGPAGTRGQVSSFDLGVLPMIAIERVEILKDGASSVYGSDAIAGVVNFITKKGDGLEFDVFASQPFDSGGELRRLGVSWGETFSRGRFRITGDYHVDRELAFGDRDYLSCGNMNIFDPDTGERADAVDPRTGEPSCNGLIWGHVWIYDYQGPGGNVPPGAKAQYDYDGDLGGYLDPITADPNDPLALRAPPGWYLVNYDKYTDGITNYKHPFYDDVSLIPETERATFYGEGEAYLTETMELYAEVLINRRKTSVNRYRQFWGTIFNENYFGGNPLSAGWTGAQWLSPTAVTDHADDRIEVDYQRYVAGLRGEISRSWNYDISFQYSKSDGESADENIYADSVVDQNWLTGSCVGMNTSVRGVPCQDIPWLDPVFLAGEISPEMSEFLFGWDEGKTVYRQWSVDAYVTGELWDLPAGKLATAFGLHYREDKINDVPGEISLAGNKWGTFSYGITRGRDTTRAVYAEFDIPLLADKPGLEELNLNLSGRYTDVESYGGDTTYKAGLSWQIVPPFRFRVSHATSFRTPALFEQIEDFEYGLTYQRSVDPCIQWGSALAGGSISQQLADNCAATLTPLYPDGLPPDYTGGIQAVSLRVAGGRGYLEAERGESTTVGIIWTPGLGNFSAALDYFTFTVNDQVDQLGPAGIVFACYSSEFFPTDPLCSLFDRSNDNSGIDNVNDSYINVAEQKNRGWDLSMQYATDVGGAELILDTQFNYQVEAVTALFEETARDTNGEFGEPKLVGRLDASWYKNDWQLHYGLQYIGEVSNEKYLDGDLSTYRGETVRVKVRSGPIVYHNVSVAKSWDSGLMVRLGVSNLFDQAPPRVTTLDLGAKIDTVGNSAFASQYDYYGRRAWLNVTYTVR